MLPEEDDGTRAALANKDVVKAAAEMLKSRAGHQYYLRSCPAVVPSSVSNLIRVLSNGTAQIDAIIPAIVTAFIPVSGYFLQARSPLSHPRRLFADMLPCRPASLKQSSSPPSSSPPFIFGGIAIAGAALAPIEGVFIEGACMD